MSNPGVDSMAGHVALRSSTTSLPEAGRHVLAVVCALSCALIAGCDKNPNAPSTGNPADTATFLELIFVAVDVLVFPGEEQFFPVYKFTRAGPDPGCNENHWHSSEAVPSFGFVAADGEFIVWDLTELPPGDVKKWQDPNPTGCGYGKVSEVMEVRLVTVTRIKLQAYYDVFGGPD